MHDEKPEIADDKAGATLPYGSPHLRVYGSVGALTQKVGKNGTTVDSGGMGNMTKTS